MVKKDSFEVFELPTEKDGTVAPAKKNDEISHFLEYIPCSKLPTMEELTGCFEEDDTLFPSLSREDNFLEPSSLSHKNHDECKINIPEVPYKFYCKRSSKNLAQFIDTTDGSCNSITNYRRVSIFDHNQFDTNERVIPDYSIGKDGMKNGTFNFDFYSNIIDSIRNMRPLTNHQIAYLDVCTKEECREIIMEYNDVMAIFVENILSQS